MVARTALLESQGRRATLHALQAARTDLPEARHLEGLPIAPATAVAAAAAALRRHGWLLLLLLLLLLSNPSAGLLSGLLFRPWLRAAPGSLARCLACSRGEPVLLRCACPRAMGQQV